MNKFVGFEFKGFAKIETGGGCTALRRELTRDRYALVTVECEAPTGSNGDFAVGLYRRSDDEQIDHEFVFSADEVNNLIALWECACPKCKFDGLLHVTDDDEQEYECRNCGALFTEYPVKKK